METLRERLQEMQRCGGELDLGEDFAPAVEHLSEPIIENRERIQKLETAVAAIKIFLKRSK